jgi:GTP-binding protein Era
MMKFIPATQLLLCSHLFLVGYCFQSPMLVSSIFSSRISGKIVDDQEESIKFDLPSQEQLDQALQYAGRLPSGGEDHRCGYVCIVGAPNMGKSTLLNALLQESLSVATRRPQTTRHAILGLMTDEHVQVCLMDTPGVIEAPAYKLQEGMMEAVRGAIVTADVLLVVTDVFSTPIPNDDLFRTLQATDKPVIVAINKIDLIDQVNPDTSDPGKTFTVEQAIVRWRSLLPRALAILPMAASQGPDQVGIVALRSLLIGKETLPEALRDLGRPIEGMFLEKTITPQQAQRLLPLGPPLYEADALTDRSERFFASEIIRGALFTNLKKEVPYCCEVRIQQFREPRPSDKKALIRIAADVVVERESQKSIVVGKGGETIKKVGIEARQELEGFLQSQVHLDLNVKVEKDWRKNQDILKSYGYIR